ncbi:MAG TPA: sulfatase-like hydrolase/transferase [Polyangiaceae bacterium]|nr:sulfatase-like hydrolase/transferase [Polyangiaceae bacterium]
MNSVSYKGLTALALLGLVMCSPAAEVGDSDVGSSEAALGEPLNFIVLLTDDQRFDSLWAMPILQQRLAAEGVNFVNAYVSVPLCCPERASMLSGGFLAQNTGVIANIPPNGGFEGFPDENSMAVVLQNGGYKTGLIGKYMNGYNAADGYVPPGWDTWYSVDAFELEETLWPEAQSFIAAHESEPFFLYLAPANPHPPATPVPADANLFPDYVYSDRGYSESDFSDKPSWSASTRSDHGPDAADAAAEEELHRNMLRSLQEVDRVVGALMDDLEARSMLDRTVIFFASDNGYLWGEHGLYAKRYVYEESSRVPFVVHMPGVAAREDDALAVSNLDIPATIYDLAGIDSPTDGTSLAARLADPAVPLRDSLLIEHYGSGFPSVAAEVYAALRSRDDQGNWKYVEYASGDKELYELDSDPFELDSRHNDATLASRKASMAAELAPQKGVAITSLARKANATQGATFSRQLTAWGGNGQYTWSILEGALPGTVTLNTSTGKLSGVPDAVGDYTVRIQVADTKLASYANEPQRFVHELTISVAAGGGGGTGGSGGTGGTGGSGGNGGVAGTSGSAGTAGTGGTTAMGGAGGDGAGGETTLGGAGGDANAGGAGGDATAGGAGGEAPVSTGGAPMEPSGGNAGVPTAEGGAPTSDSGGAAGTPASDDGGTGATAEGGAPHTSDGGKAGAPAEAGATANDAATSADDSGCGCRVPNQRTSSPAGLGLLLALAALARRRRR